MEAIIFDKGGQPTLKFVKDREIPKPVAENDVIVKVAYSGVCGTDIHIIHGVFPCTDKFPLVLGHEFCGTVVDAGPKAAFKKGQRVVVDPNNPCNLCYSCHSGHYQLCHTCGINNNIGIYRNGGWAEYCLAPDDQVFPIPDNMTFEQAALCEPISCLSHGWDRMSPVPIGEKILIIGAGIIGNLWAILLHLQGHRSVTVSEPNLNRLTMAKHMNLGFDYVTPDDLKKSGRLFDLVIDCTGVAKVLEENFDHLADGAKYVVFGCSKPDEVAKINPFMMYLKELSIIAVKINPYSFPKALGFISSLGDRYLDYEMLGIKTFKLSQFQEATDKLKTGEISKAIFKVE